MSVLQDKILTIVLRTCIRPTVGTSPIGQWTRICGNDRLPMVIKCLKSLITSINNSKYPINLIVLDDNSTDDGLSQIHDVLSGCQHQFNVINLQIPANLQSFKHSAFEQFKTISEIDGLVYSIEDDYLHESDAVSEMVQCYEQLSKKFYNDKIVIFPFDCPFIYEAPRIEPTLLLYLNGRYWRQVTHTTNSFLTHGTYVKEFFEVYQNLALNYPIVREADTIDKLYRGFSNATAPLTVFNPIPSLAYHLSYAEPNAIQTPYTTWQSIWNTL